MPAAQPTFPSALRGGKSGNGRRRFARGVVIAAFLAPTCVLAIESAPPAAATTGGATLYAWGSNASGQLGDGTTTNQANPEAITLAPGVTPTAISAGWRATLAIGSDGNLYAWGDNTYGELGDGTTIGHVSPELITLAAGVQPIAISTECTCDLSFSLAIGSDFKLYAWGANEGGELGNGSIGGQVDHPVVVSMPTGVTAISAGDPSLAIGADGHLYAWGAGYMGNGGSSTIQDIPARVLGITPTSISAGYFYSLVLGSNGDFYSWGDNSDGELGDGTTTPRTTPEVITLPSGLPAATVSAFRAGGYAIDSHGQLYGWGTTTTLGNGIIGNGTFQGQQFQSSPVAINLAPGVTTGAISASQQNNLAIGSDGKVYAWGFNLGTYQPSPAAITLPSSVPPTAIAAGENYNLVLTGAATDPASLVYGTAARTTMTGIWDCHAGCDGVDGDVGRVRTITWGVSSDIGFAVGYGSLYGGMSVGSDSLANDGGTTAGAGVVFRSFRNTTSQPLTLRANAVVSGDFKHDFADSALAAEADVYVFDTTMFSAALAAGGLPAGQVLLEGSNPINGIPAGALLGHGSIDPLSCPASTCTNDGFGNITVAAPVRTGPITIAPDQAFTVLFLMHTNAASEPFGGTLGTGWVNFSDTLTEAPNFFTGTDGNPVTGVTDLGPAPGPPPTPATALTLTPASANNLGTATDTVTATATTALDQPAPNAIVQFAVTSGPNVGLTGTGVTDANGHAIFNYTDTGGAGTDTIRATIGGLASNTVRNTWQGCITTTYSGRLIVRSGQAVCVTSGGKLAGPVTVSSGGTLAVNGGTITGPVTATGAASLTFCLATVTSPLTVTGSTGPVMLGGPGCLGNTFTAPVRITGNTGGVSFSTNTLTAPLTITGNTGGFQYSGNTDTAPTTVSGNS
jgi:hypothetical protein